MNDESAQSIEVDEVITAEGHALKQNKPFARNASRETDESSRFDGFVGTGGVFRGFRVFGSQIPHWLWPFIFVFGLVILFIGLAIGLMLVVPYWVLKLFVRAVKRPN